jgi:hypothetical protein
MGEVRWHIVVEGAERQGGGSPSWRWRWRGEPKLEGQGGDRADAPALLANTWRREGWASMSWGWRG